MVMARGDDTDFNPSKSETKTTYPPFLIDGIGSLTEVFFKYAAIAVLVPIIPAVPIIKAGQKGVGAILKIPFVEKTIRLCKDNFTNSGIEQKEKRKMDGRQRRITAGDPTVPFGVPRHRF